MWTDALESGIEAIEFYGKIKRYNRTLLDALYPVLEALKKSPENYVRLNMYLYIYIYIYM